MKVASNIVRLKDYPSITFSIGVGNIRKNDIFGKFYLIVKHEVADSMHIISKSLIPLEIPKNDVKYIKDKHIIIKDTKQLDPACINIDVVYTCIGSSKKDSINIKLNTALINNYYASLNVNSK